MGRAIALVGLLVSVPTWVLWLAVAHDHEIGADAESILLGVLCVGMGAGFVGGIGVNVRASLITGRLIYKVGYISALVSEAVVFGTLIHQRTAGVFVGDMLGDWAVLLYVGVGGAYGLSVLALPPAADDEIKTKRDRQAERLEEANREAIAANIEAAKQRQRADQLAEKVERLLVEAASSGRSRKTIPARLLESALAEPQWLDAEEWALRAGLTAQQVRSAVAKLDGRLATHYTDEGRAMYAAKQADGSLPEWSTT